MEDLSQYPLRLEGDDTPLVRFMNVTKRYGDLVVLDSLDLDVAPGEMVTIIGPSGSGKTTVLRMLMTLETINGGVIYVDGEPLTHMEQGGKLVPANARHLRRMRANIGMCFQHFNLFPHMTALENCMEAPVHVLGLPKREARERSMELLEMVNRGEAQVALIDSNEFAVQQSLYPRLKVAFDLSPRQDMVWYLPPDVDNTRLLARIDALFERLDEDGTLARLRELHFGHARTVSRVGSHRFTRMMRSALPPYRPLIQRVAEEYQMDWRLLAAIAYQESHWDPLATSPTGVRGMMMLTLPTAKEMGVSNRLDAAQSLRGGARYFRDIKRRLPADIPEPDRSWLALAAYNIGMGHLEDARVLTERQGGDPDLWRDVMERLPLLQQSTHYRTLRYGYARGLEAVTFVQNIRHYYSILRWQDIPDNNPGPPLRGDDFLPEVLRAVQLRAL